jgi:hypothetical protein
VGVYSGAALRPELGPTGSTRRSPASSATRCEAITDLDVTAAEMLEQLDLELNAAGMHSIEAAPAAFAAGVDGRANPD